jgi:hypothetical protein
VARNDVKFQTRVRASRRDAPEVCMKLPPKEDVGNECRVPAAPAASCAPCIGKKVHSAPIDDADAGKSVDYLAATT